MSCKDKIGEYHQDEGEELIKAQRSGRRFDEFNERILSIDYHNEERKVRIVLSWGGPADGWDLYVDGHYKIIKMCYWYQDWSDYAEESATPEELRAAKGIWEELLPDIIKKQLKEEAKYG